MTAKSFWAAVWAELNGSAHRRRIEKQIGRQISEETLREAVALIRRFYLPQPPTDSPEYDRGYGDCILDMTRLLDPDGPIHPLPPIPSPLPPTLPPTS